MSKLNKINGNVLAKEVKTVLTQYLGVVPILVNQETKEISIDLTNIITKDGEVVDIKNSSLANVLDAVLDTDGTPLGQVKTIINDNTKDLLSKTTTDKQFITGDVNFKGKVQVVLPPEFDVDALSLGEANKLYVAKTGNTTADTIIANAVSAKTLDNRATITFGDAGKTAINKEYLEKVIPTTIASAVSQSLNPNLLVENVDYTFTTNDKVRTITFTKSLMDYELFTYETFGTNAKNVNAQGIFKPNNNHFEDMLLNYKSTKTWYAIGVEWLPDTPNVIKFRTTDNQAWNGQELVMYGRLR